MTPAHAAFSALLSYAISIPMAVFMVARMNRYRHERDLADTIINTRNKTIGVLQNEIIRLRDCRRCQCGRFMAGGGE